jgi:ribosome-binding factor A
MTQSSVTAIKRAQKESVILRTISELVARASADDSRLSGMFVTRAELSPGKSSCTIYFYTADGADVFKEKLEVLKLYKPSMRKTLANTLQSKYTPEIVFKFDEKFEKTHRIETILEKLKADNQL